MYKVIIGILLGLEILSSCSGNDKFKCEAINQQLNQIESNNNAPWIKLKFNNITTTNKTDKVLSCHAIINYTDVTGKTHLPKLDSVDYKLYLADNQKDTSLVMDHTSTAQINSTISSYLLNSGASIKSYQNIASGNYIYVYKESDYYVENLILGTKVIESSDNIELSQNYKLDGKDTFAYVINEGNAVEDAMTIIQVDKKGKYTLTNENITANLDDVIANKNQLFIPDKDGYRSFVYKNGKLLITDTRPTTIDMCKKVFIKEVGKILQNNKDNDNVIYLFTLGFVNAKIDDIAKYSNTEMRYYNWGSHLTENMPNHLKNLCLPNSLSGVLNKQLKH